MRAFLTRRIDMGYRDGIYLGTKPVWFFVLAFGTMLSPLIMLVKV